MNRGDRTRDEATCRARFGLPNHRRVLSAHLRGREAVEFAGRNRNGRLGECRQSRRDELRESTPHREVPASCGGLLSSPVIRSAAGRRTAVSCAERPIDGRARLKTVRRFEGSERLGATVAHHQGIAQVVVSICLVGVSRSGSRKIDDSRAKRRNRGCVSSAANERIPFVVQAMTARQHGRRRRG
jgi:hypothetical protein